MGNNRIRRFNENSEHEMRKEINKFKDFLNENSEEKLNISDVSDSIYYIYDELNKKFIR